MKAVSFGCHCPQMMVPEIENPFKERYNSFFIYKCTLAQVLLLDQFVMPFLSSRVMTVKIGSCLGVGVGVFVTLFRFVTFIYVPFLWNSSLSVPVIAPAGEEEASVVMFVNMIGLNKWYDILWTFVSFHLVLFSSKCTLAQVLLPDQLKMPFLGSRIMTVQIRKLPWGQRWVFSLLCFGFSHSYCSVPFCGILVYLCLWSLPLGRKLLCLCSSTWPGS